MAKLKAKRIRECPSGFVAAIKLANQALGRQKRRQDGLLSPSPEEARAKLKRIIAEVEKSRLINERMETAKKKVDNASSLPGAAEWEKDRALNWNPLIHTFQLKTKALLYVDEKGFIKPGFDLIDRAIIGEKYERLILELDRLRECKNPKCGRIFWAGRSTTMNGKRVEGCGSTCLNILRLRRRDRPPTEQEIKAVGQALETMYRVMNKQAPWEFEQTREQIEELAERAETSKGRVIRTLPEVIKRIKDQRAKTVPKH